MTDLGPEAMDLLRLADGADDPTPADEARMRGKIAMQLGVATGIAVLGTTKTAAAASSALTTGAAGVAGAATTGAAGAAAGSAATITGAAAATTTTVGIFGKVAVGAALLGAIGGGTAYVATTAHTAAPSYAVVASAAPTMTHPTSPAPPRVPSADDALSAASAVPEALPTAPPVVAPEAPSTSLPRAPLDAKSAVTPGPAPGTMPAAVPGSSAQVAPDTLVVELALLHDAQGALARGDANLALAKVSEHQKQFPRGSLTPEREGTKVLALCAAGRTAEARVAGESFLGAYGKSPLADRVRHSCMASPSPAAD